MTLHESYRAAGVDYAVLDQVKRLAIEQARATGPVLAGVGGREHEQSRGASAFVFDVGGLTLALVVEGLGTKAVIAAEYRVLTGANRFADIAVDAVAAITNDVISVGARPLVVNAYFATGSADWYADEERATALFAGWRDACVRSGAVWGGGESPALPGVVVDGALELAGSAVGLVPEGHRPVLGTEIAPGDVIIGLESSGLHANGSSLARRVAAALPAGLRTALPSGRDFGAALLDPTILYAPFVSALLDADVRARYLNGVTGHGLMKLMRSPAEVRYLVDDLPPVPEVLRFLADRAGLDDDAAYATLNMGLGYLALVTESDADTALGLARQAGFRPHVLGRVTAGERSVEVRPLGLRYHGAEYTPGA